MLFNSLEFLIFFPIVVAAYYLLPAKLKNYWLLIASYYFYMCWNAKYALLLLGSTAITYFGAILIGKGKCVQAKKAFLAGSLVLNFGLLAFFKYTNFLLETVQSLFSFLHISLNVPRFDIVLPVGISFFVFQAVGYTIDVYRGETAAERNFFRYALFVSFFPQLVAGPIERSKNLLSQLKTTNKFNFEKARDGFLVILWGFFLKLVVADRIGIFVDTVYDNMSYYGGEFIVVAAFLFVIQVYCDFYGYSTIAKGAAQILGIELMENFSSPFLQTSVASFWRNWHISLTSWFKDYLYIPLGGNRKGKFRKEINKLIVFSLSGLWHGANITFVLWGFVNGLYQVIGDLLTPARKKAATFLRLNTESLGHKLVRCFVTVVLVDISFIFFRLQSVSDVVFALKSIVTNFNFWIYFDGSLFDCGLDRQNFMLLIVCLLVLLAADICKKKGIVIREIVAKQDYWIRWVVFAASILAILIFGKYGPAYDSKNFIYFQF